MADEPLPLIEILYSALRTPRGIVVDSEDAKLLRQKLYLVRRETQDESLRGIKLILSRTNPQRELLVINVPETQDDAEG